MQKTGWCRVQKAVLVTVYTTKPTRRKASSNINHHHHHHLHHLHHHHHHYHHVHHRRRPHSTVGYDRKAELLLYAQHLRTLSRGATTPGYRTTYSNTPEKLVPVSRKRKYKRSPTCLGDWRKILLPSFVLRSLASFKEKKRRRKKGGESTSSKMSTMITLQAQKQGLVKKLLSAFRKQK